MTRNTAREIAIQLSFAASAAGRDPLELADEFFSEEHYASLAAECPLYEERPDKRQMGYIRSLTQLIAQHKDEIDSIITANSHGWKLERISRTALAVLRVALCEILYMDDIPAKASINEAIELDKNYDVPDTVSFVNGVLGGFMRSREAQQTAD